MMGESSPQCARTPGPVWPWGCWPDQDQELLLRACLLDDERAASDAFREWHNRVPQFFMDAGTPKIVALLFNRLQTLEVPPRDLQRLCGIARYYWTQSQLLDRQLRRLLGLLAESDIPTLLIKGAALNNSVYRDRSRVMSDLDVVVPRTDALRTMELLQRSGWRSLFREPEQITQVTHACHFENDDGGQLDLHWDFFHGRPFTDTERSVFWDASVPVMIGDRPTRMLCPADQLLHTCEHGVRYNVTPPYRWLVDAVAIIWQYEDQLDWSRLRELAVRSELILPVQQTLRYLHERLELPLPEREFKELMSVRPRVCNRAEHWLKTRKLWGSHSFIQQLPLHLLEYPRYRRQHPGLTRTEFLTSVSNFAGPFRKNLNRILRIQLTSLNDRWSRWWARSRSLLNIGSDESFYSLSSIDSQMLEGFYDPEDHNGIVFRGSAPTAATNLKLHPRAQSLTLQLAPFRSLDGDVCEQLQIRLNQSVVPRERVSIEDWEVRIPVARHMLVDRAVQRLEIKIPAWEIGGGDPRQLGVPLVGIKYREA